MTNEQLDVVTKALRRAWSLGQTYWSQADSESYSQNRRADETQLAFQRLVEDTRAALASDHALACTASNDSMAVSAAPQAEPKREPLSDERIDEIGDPFGYFQYGDAQGDKRRAFARAVERAAYERAAALVIELTEDNATADAIRALGRKHD